jgi:hypothetical protein
VSEQGVLNIKILSEFDFYNIFLSKSTIFMQDLEYMLIGDSRTESTIETISSTRESQPKEYIKFFSLCPEHTANGFAASRKFSGLGGF